MSTSYPDVYTHLSTELLLTAFNRGPQRLREVTRGLTEDELRARPVAGKWSIFEIVLHLADAEIMGAARFRLALAESSADAPGYDQEAWARELSYAEQDSAAFGEALALFEALTLASSRLLRKASVQDWRRSVRHGEWGRMTLRQLLELYADHRERHIEQILTRRRLLGSPLDFPILIETRLY